MRGARAASCVGLLGDSRRAGQRIAAYGAAAKGSTLLNAFGIGRETIDFVVDRSTHKQGRYMPGVQHPDRRPRAGCSTSMPDYVLLLAWNFADEILAQQAEYRRAAAGSSSRSPSRGGVSRDRRRAGRSRSTRIPDERGTIMHMLKRTDPHFIEFGEIYFSTVYPGVVKGWHQHGEMTLNYACVYGRIKLVLYDDREGSPTQGELDGGLPRAGQLQPRRDLPPEVWNGFKGMSDPYAIVANCATHPHDPSRSERLDPFDNDIPYDWAVRQH